MKRYYLFGLMLFFATAVQSLEIQSKLSWDNSFFDTSLETSLGATAATFAPKGNLNWHISLKESIGDNFWVRLEDDQDIVLRNRLAALFGLEYNLFSVYVGPLFSPFVNDTNILNPGLSTELAIRLPGVIFFSFKNETTLGPGLNFAGDFFQTHSSVEAGFWIPNVIFSGRISLSRFLEYLQDDQLANDERIRYEVICHFYQKNKPYQVEVRLGYLESSRMLRLSDGQYRDSLYSLLLGSEVVATLNSKIKILVDGELYLVPWTKGGMRKPREDSLLYQVSLGLQLNLPQIVPTK